MVSSTGILVKRDSTSYEKSSYSFELDTFFTESGRVKVSKLNQEKLKVIVYSFLAKGFRCLAITFDALYI